MLPPNRLFGRFARCGVGDSEPVVIHFDHVEHTATGLDEPLRRTLISSYGHRHWCRQCKNRFAQVSVAPSSYPATSHGQAQALSLSRISRALRLAGPPPYVGNLRLFSGCGSSILLLAFIATAHGDRLYWLLSAYLSCFKVENTGHIGVTLRGNEGINLLLALTIGEGC